jgi:thiol:disulfide interchange protein DsbD
MKLPIFFLMAAPAALFAATPATAPVSTDHVRAELIAEDSALVPGQRSWLGVRLTHEPHWHTYWTNPGDSGLPTKLKWDLPTDLIVGDIAWPAPQRFDVGGLFNVGYSGEVVLPVPIAVVGGATGTSAHLAVEARWLVCREECVPGKATLTLELPIAATATPDRRWAKAFAAAHAAQPVASTWTGQARLVGDSIDVVLTGADLPGAEQTDAFVVQNQVVGYAPPKITKDSDALMLKFAKSEYFTRTPATLDLVVVDGMPAALRARSVAVPFAAVESVSTRP